jgi:putative SOS response-associated peptidase YedK
MCGPFTYRLTWPEIVKLYRLTLDYPARNTQAGHNVCSTTTIDTILDAEARRQLRPMRWGLIPSWWQKPLKDMKLATFNARAETLAEKPMFRAAFKSNRCLIPASGYCEWHDTPDGKQPCYFTRADGQPVTIAGFCDEWNAGLRLQRAVQLIDHHPTVRRGLLGRQRCDHLSRRCSTNERSGTTVVKASCARCK